MPSIGVNIFGGSCFDYVSPAIGVTLLENGKQKKGEINYLDKFGKMSKYEYDRMRQQYNSESSNRNNPIYKEDFNFGKIAERDILTKKEENLLGVANSNINGNRLLIKSDLVKLKNTFEAPNSTYKQLSYHKSESVINENIFKNRKLTEMKKGKLESVEYKDMDNFNKGIINNHQWGSEINNNELFLNKIIFSSSSNNIPIKPSLGQLQKDLGKDNF